MQSRIYPKRSEHVYLFVTCLVDMFVPEAGMDAVRLLEREGITVHYPEQQSCCGQPAYSSGNPEQARAVAAAQMALFTEDWPVIVPSGSCAGMMRHHWVRLFADDAQQAQRAANLSERVFELTEYLQQVLQLDFAQLAQANTQTERVALHTSCGARREMGTRQHGVATLAQLPAITLTEHQRESECCGFGGTFSLKHPAISGAMVMDKLAALRATSCQGVVTADCGCLLNLRHAAEYQQQPVRIEHMASFLWRRTNAADALQAELQTDLQSAKSAGEPV